MIKICFLLSALTVSIIYSQTLPVELYLDEPSGISRTADPITTGIPLPQGLVSDSAGLTVTDGNGTPVPCQLQVMNRWPFDNSIRWLLMDFQADVSAGQTKTFKLASSAPPSAGTGLSVTEDNSFITVNTGTIRFKVNKQSFSLFDSVWIDLNDNKAFEANELIVTGSQVSMVSSSVSHLTSVAPPRRVFVEETGPMRIAICAEGTHRAASGGVTDGFYDYTIRIHAFAGSGLVYVNYTFRNSRQYPTEAEFICFPFTAQTVDLDLNLGSQKTFTIKGENNPVSGTLSSEASVLQSDYGSYTITNNSTTAESGAHALGFVDLSDNNFGVTVAIRRFWENFPKGVKMTPAVMTLELLPQISGTQYWMSPLKHKTHEMMFYFHKGTAAAAKSMDRAESFLHRIFAVAPPIWYATSRAWDGGFCRPDDPLPSKKAPHVPDNIQGDYPKIGWKAYGANYETYAGNSGGDPHDCAISQFQYFLQTRDYNYLDEILGHCRHSVDQWADHVDGQNLEFSYIDSMNNDIWELYRAGGQRSGPGFQSAVTEYGAYFSGYDYPGYQQLNNAHRGTFPSYEWYWMTGDCHAIEAITSFSEWSKLGGYYPMFYLRGGRYPSETRGVGWILVNLTWAYRVSGQQSHLDFAKRFIHDYDDGRLPLERALKLEKPRGHYRNGIEAPFQVSICMEGLDMYYRETLDEVARDCIWGFSYWLKYFVGTDTATAQHPYYWDPVTGGIGQGSMQHHPRDGYMWGIAYRYSGDSLFLRLGDKWLTTNSAHTGDEYYECNQLFLFEKKHRGDWKPPAQITDLRAEPGFYHKSVKLTWTAPADDQGLKEYVVKYSPKSRPLVERAFWPADFVNPGSDSERCVKAAFFQGENIDYEPAPLGPGNEQSVQIKDLELGTEYTFAIKAVDKAHNVSALSNIAEALAQTGIENEAPGSDLPRAFKLGDPMPNPFNPSTMIQLSIPRQARAVLKIFNIRGVLVATLLDKELKPGKYSVEWHGRGLNSGMYIAKLRAGNKLFTRKLILLK
jgi:hypothetical protein